MKIILLFIIGILLAYLLYYVKTPKAKGMIGESKLLRVLGSSDESIGKYVIYDYRFKVNDKSIQIDCILVCTKGIIVIECKNYSGMIFGSKLEHNWTQTLKYGKVKNKFYNPIKQNASHCYNLKSIVKNKYPIISVVVFVNGDISNIEEENVVELNNLQNYIDNLPEKIDIEEIKKIAKSLYDNECDISEKEHIQNINETLEKIENNICPRCGGNIVERNGKYGKFYGCSNYPKCKFKKKDF